MTDTISPLPDGLIDALRDAVGPKGLLTEEGDVEPYVIEERGLYHGSAGAVVRPASTEEVAAVVKLCSDAGVPITPQGGNTGLVGGGVPDGGIVLSLQRMNAVRERDPDNHTLTVEAGVVLADVQSAADEMEALFPLSLGAEGSCRIGGNLATNAGGVNVLRYGNARDLVLGLEVVLPDGTVWNGLRGLRKDNTGYDLKHLFMGSEGTLGIITAAVLKLFPKPRSVETALAAVPTPEAALQLFRRARADFGDTLNAFELISRFALEITDRHVEGASNPFDDFHPWTVLLELSSPRKNDDLGEALESLLGDAFEAEEVVDAVLAQSGAQRQTFWHIRESIPEAQKVEGGSIKHDVSVPVSKVPELLDRAAEAVGKALPGIRPCPFGHMGDGNIHLNLTQPEGADKEAYLERWAEMNDIVHGIVAELGGSISAEHGLGRLKVEEVTHYKSEVELDLMRRIKRAIDPGGCLNPGKVIKG